MTAPRRPLLLLLNGSFHTLDPERPHAAAVAVDRTSGRVVAVGGGEVAVVAARGAEGHVQIETAAPLGTAVAARRAFGCGAGAHRMMSPIRLQRGQFFAGSQDQ